MAAVLRVKRRNDGEPLEALVIACKKRKSEDKEDDEAASLLPLTTILKFAGTVKNQEDDVVEHLAKTLSKDELKSNFKQHPVDIRAKARRETKKSSEENRYKVINCLRSLDTSAVQELESKTMTLIDLEDSVSCNAKAESKEENENGYVYDLYYAETGNELYLEDLVHVSPLDQELVFDGYRDGCSENECESEDSNSESNWRNDYPDSDDSSDSMDTDNMRAAMRDMRLAGEVDTSSEGDDDSDEMRAALRNVRPDDMEDTSSEEDFVYAVDHRDVVKYGYEYAKYKARIKKELESDDNEASSEN